VLVAGVELAAVSIVFPVQLPCWFGLYSTAYLVPVKDQLNLAFRLVFYREDHYI